ncbi:hypothetical protein JW992_12065 [candidate division KSB1 bacterium]|nr:hypothetical protein [candidate division KSB1 bacterium]
MPFVRYAVLSGRMPVPFALNQPWTALEIRRALPAMVQRDLPAWQRHWLRLLVQELAAGYRIDTTADEHAGLGYIGVSGAWRGFTDDNRQWDEYRAALEGRFAARYFALAHRTAIDKRFKNDPAYWGDTGEWVWGRVESGYLSLRYRGISAFVGRMDRNWGLPGETSLILSDNPYSYDFAGLQLESRRFRFSFYTTRLDDVVGRDISKEFSVSQNYSRYWAIKRFDLALHPDLQIGFSEAAIYGAVNGAWEIAFLNPLGLVYVEQRNKRKQMNGLWSADVLWRPGARLALYTQLLIDDIIVNNEPGQDDRGEHPDRMGITAKAIFSDLPVPGSLLGIVYTRIGNWTYLSYRNYENYIYQGLGLGYPFNAIERVGAEWDFFGWTAWVVRLQAGYSRRGETRLTDPFGDTREAFPRGTVEYCADLRFDLLYQPSLRWGVRLFGGFARIHNAGNLVGAEIDSPSAGIELHFRLGHLQAL